MNSRGVSFVILAYLYSTKQSAPSGFIYSNLCNTRCEIMSLTHTSCDTFMTIPIHVTYLLHIQQDKYYKLVQCFFAYSHLFQYFFTFQQPLAIIRVLRIVQLILTKLSLTISDIIPSRTMFYLRLTYVLLLGLVLGTKYQVFLECP